MGPGSRRCALFAASVAVSLLHAPTHAARPLDTDDAAMLPAGACQLQAFARSVREPDAGAHSRDFGFAPSCNPFGWGELLAGVERGGVGQPDPASRGVLQFKGVPRAVSAESAGWGYVIAYGEDLARHTSRDAARAVKVSGIASIRPRPEWEIDANFGWLHEWTPSIANRRGHPAWGVAVQWSASPRLTLVAERTGTRDLGRSVQVGLTFAASRYATLDIATGRTRQPGSRGSLVTIGLTLVSDFAAAP